MKTETLPYIAFDSHDVAAAYRDWGCNCGPAALAASLDLTLDAVRPHLGDFEQRRFMNPTQMQISLVALMARWRAIPNGTGPPWPENGVVRIQFGGPWLKPGVPVGAAYARTHWLASRKHEGADWVCDVSAGWLPAERWEAEILPLLVKWVSRADGTWFPTHRWEVRR